MTLNNKVNNFVSKVLKLLKPMKKVTVSEEQEIYYLIKNNVVFAEIYQNKIYLRYSNRPGYIILTERDVNDKDSFLVQAKLSYFWAEKDNNQNYAT